MTDNTPAIDLVDGHWYAEDVHQKYSWMRENAPVYHDKANDVWALTKYDDIVTASRSPELFCSGKGMRPNMEDRVVPSMINMDDPEHKLRRLIVSRGFTPRRVADHRAQIENVCAELVEKMVNMGHCDFVHDIAAPLPMFMIGDMMGVHPDDRDQLLEWSDDLLLGTTAEHRRTPEIDQRTEAASMGYAMYTLDVVNNRRANPGGSDLMSLLVEADIDGHTLSDEDLIHESMLILIGGDETTRHVITGGTEVLLRNPDSLHQLQSQPELLPTAIEEMLRWVTPIHNMARTTTQEVEVRGVTIPKDATVLLMYAAANRDEDVFDRPQEFVVDRQPNRHIAFGGNGPHFCLGAALARLELRAMFEQLLPVLSRVSLTEENLPMRQSNFIVGIEQMPVSVT